MIPLSRTLAAPPEDLNLGPRTHIRRFTTSCNSSSKISDTFVWFPKVPATQMTCVCTCIRTHTMHTYIHTNKNVSLKRKEDHYWLRNPLVQKTDFLIILWKEKNRKILFFNTLNIPLLSQNVCFRLSSQ